MLFNPATPIFKTKHMSKHYKGFVVSMDKEIHEDESEGIMSALAMIKGVVGVSPVESDAGDMIVKMKIKAEVNSELYDLIDKVRNL